jgi:lambda family phage minor tail protein L
MSLSVLHEAQNLNTDPLVELWELDTTQLTNIYGETGTGTTYHWTPGILNYRMEGFTANASSASIVVLDKLLSVNPALHYTIQVPISTDNLLFTDPIPITAFGTFFAADLGHDVTIVGLDRPLPINLAPGLPWVVESLGSVFFGGIEYVPAPIEFTDHEWSGQGKLPRPKLKVSNIGGLAAALVIQFGDIVGAQVKRIQTFKQFLDGEVHADPSAAFEPDIYVVDRKSSHTKSTIEFELAATLDQQGVALPKRLILRDTCSQTYRQWSTTGGGGHFVYGTCPFTDETRFYKADGTATANPAEDLCGKRLTDCILRFGPTANLPTSAFPGAAEIKV